MSQPPQPRCTFPRSRRLGGGAHFDRVFDAGVKVPRGPILAFARPNGLPHPRLGLSVSRRVGCAAVRNRIKRLLREAFRLHQHDLPAGYDLVLIVRPHEPLILPEYGKIMVYVMLKLHQAWQLKQQGG
ncbi:MAG: ribonuclease P protein component [Tepidisphaeraceae bacterium]|jgi:ribonuclease P protein component